MKTEIHLFMIWEKGRYMENDIFNDLKQNFKLLDAYHIHWNKDDFNKNLSRFYGQNLPKNCHKHEHVGDGIMSLYIVEDDEPKYDMRQTSKGEEKVNVNVFDKKVLYRNWTGGGHKIHSSNDQKEAKADILLLTGSLYENFISKKWDGEYKYSNELHGNSGWDSVEQIFEILNVRINYVVLRNFECLPNQYYCDKHGDIDLLVDNLDLSVSLLNAEKVFNERYRVHYKIKIGKDQVLFDFRYVGDKYYCTKWEKNILDHKVKYNGINVPDKINHKYSLLYHALIHKPNVSEDYQKKLEKLFYNINLNKLPNILFEYIEKNGFYITDPIDQSVYYNYKYAKEINIQRILYYNLKYNIKIPLNSPVLKNNIENSYENNKKVLTALNADNKRLLLINMGLGLISFSKIITDKLLVIF